MKIVLLTSGQKPEEGETIAWAEYNSAREDYTDKQRLRIIAWDAEKDEPVVNLGYDTGEFEKD